MKLAFKEACLRGALQHLSGPCYQGWIWHRHHWHPLNPQNPPPGPAAKKLWRGPQLRLQVALECPLSDLQRCWLSYQQDLLRAQRRRLRRQARQLLVLQRRALGQALHRGVCQSMTVVDLQAGYLSMCELPEQRQEAQVELLEKIRMASSDVRAFYEQRLLTHASHPESWRAELLGLWSLLDPQLQVEVEGKILRCQPSKAPPRELLAWLREVGFRIVLAKESSSKRPAESSSFAPSAVVPLS